MLEFTTRISGIPCICRTEYRPPSKRLITSATLQPDDPEDWSYEILDRRGYKAPWLQRKVTASDETQLFQQTQREYHAGY